MEFEITLWNTWRLFFNEDKPAIDLTSFSNNNTKYTITNAEKKENVPTDPSPLSTPSAKSTTQHALLRNIITVIIIIHPLTCLPVIYYTHTKYILTLSRELRNMYERAQSKRKVSRRNLYSLGRLCLLHVHSYWIFF